MKINNDPNEFDIFIGFLQVFDLILNISQTSNDVIFKNFKNKIKNIYKK